jgi:hypothetical protein
MQKFSALQSLAPHKREKVVHDLQANVHLSNFDEAA